MLLYQILAYTVLRKIEKILRKTINLTYATDTLKTT